MRAKGRDGGRGGGERGKGERAWHFRNPEPGGSFETTPQNHQGSDLNSGLGVPRVPGCSPGLGDVLTRRVWKPLFWALGTTKERRAGRNPEGHFPPLHAPSLPPPKEVSGRRGLKEASQATAGWCLQARTAPPPAGQGPPPRVPRGPRPEAGWLYMLSWEGTLGLSEAATLTKKTFPGQRWALFYYFFNVSIYF